MQNDFIYLQLIKPYWNYYMTKILRKGKLSLEAHIGDEWRPICLFFFNNEAAA